MHPESVPLPEWRVRLSSARVESLKRPTGVKFLIAIGLVMTLSNCSDVAPDPSGVAPSTPSEPELLSIGGQQGQRFRAVGRLDGCTAFVIDTGGGESTPGYAVSNGHCVQNWAAPSSAVEVVEEEAASGLQLSLDYFVDAEPTQIRVRQIAYATMKQRDVALLELDVTVAELRTMGITPLPLAGFVPAQGDTVTVVGAPLFAEEEGGDFLRQASCHALGRVDVVEYWWLWPGAHRTDCLGIRPGSSGSPLLSQTGEVYAVVSTTAVGARTDAACYLDAPCEVTAMGFSLSSANSYASDLAWLHDCFDAQGRWAPAKAACAIDRGEQLAVTNFPLPRIQPQASGGSTLFWELALLSQHGFEQARVKEGPSGQVHCEEEAGYSLPMDLADVERRGLPAGEGPHTLCLLGVGAGGAPVQSLSTATTLTVYLDSAAPTERPALSTRSFPPLVEPLFQLPEMSSFEYVLGPDIDCSDPGLPWQIFQRVPINVEPLPTRLCLRAEDLAGNQGPPHAFDLSLPQ